MADVWLGLDLGRMSDYSAVVGVRRTLRLTAGGFPERDHRKQAVYGFEIPQAKRYRKGTPYPEVIAHIRDVILPQPWIGPRPKLVIHAGGVGGGIVDMILDAALPVEPIALTITGGTAVTRHVWPRSRVRHWHVAKTELVSVTQRVFQGGRVTIYPMKPDKDAGEDHGATLKAELKGFTVKQTRAANEVYTAREGEHDDVLLAASMPIFLGHRREYFQYPAPPEAAGLAGAAELAGGEAGAFEAERKALAAAEAADRKAAEDAAWEARQELDRKRRQNPFDPTWGWSPV